MCLCVCLCSGIAAGMVAGPGPPSSVQRSIGLPRAPRFFLQNSTFRIIMGPLQRILAPRFCHPTPLCLCECVFVCICICVDVFVCVSLLVGLGFSLCVNV